MQKDIIKPSFDNPCRSNISIQENHLGGTAAYGDPDTWYPELWWWAIEVLGVRSMIDIGAGVGYTVKFFQDSNCQAYGVDGSLGVAANWKAKPGTLVLHDFTRGMFHSDRMFELVYSSEFFEHVEECFLENVLSPLYYASRFIIMSAAVPGQDGYHHVNLQPPDYWIQMIEPIGFTYCEGLTKVARACVPEKTNRRYNSWFNQNGLVFVRNSFLAMQHLPKC